MANADTQIDEDDTILPRPDTKAAVEYIGEMLGALKLLASGPELRSLARLLDAAQREAEALLREPSIS